MNTLSNKEVWDALFHGILAGAVVLVINGIGHYVFEAPEVPYAYGVAAVMTAVVAAIRLLAHSDAGSRDGA